jgi:outer membrane receptor for ferric coprogen and ferric-rhodotorulic acid
MVFCGAPLAVLAAAPPAASSTGPTATTAAKGLDDSEPILMSPFEVDASGQKGYYSPNTMAGTRLNSKLEDLASSIAVVTKEQMADFALLDINDIFL